MQIKVNDQWVEIFAGARVKDVLRKFSRTEWSLVRKKQKKVTDPYGHEVDPDGELNGGEQLLLEACTPKEPRS